MKEIKAFVHRSRVAAVVEALKESATWGGQAGATNHNLVAYVVKGSLLALDGQERHYSLDLGDEVINEYKLELICEDAQVDELVGAISTAAHTGQAHSGWIYVVDVARAVTIA